MSDDTKTTDDAIETTDTPPTLAQVEREEAKTRELRERLDEHTDEIAELEPEIAEALADGDEESARRLRASRRELIELTSDLEAAADVLDARAKQRREKATREMARKRLEAIEDEVVVGASLLDEDIVRVLEAAHAYSDAVEEVAERYAGLVRSEAEAEALADRFRDLDRPELPAVTIPFRTDAMKKALKTVQRARSKVPDRRPKRVSIDETPGAEIITESGGPERPDHVLSPEELRERRAAEERERERAEKKAAEEARVEAELNRFGAGTGSRTG